jgi:hypothetical protein
VERPELPTPPVGFERTPDGFTALLAEAGWRGAECHEIAWVHRPDPEVWWSGAAGGVANIGYVVTSQPPDVVARIKRNYDRLAREHVGADGLLAFGATALLASGGR